MAEATGRWTHSATAGATTFGTTTRGRTHRTTVKLIFLRTFFVLERVEGIGYSEHHITRQVVVTAVGDGAVAADRS